MDRLALIVDGDHLEEEEERTEVEILQARVQTLLPRQDLESVDPQKRIRKVLHAKREVVDPGPDPVEEDVLLAVVVAHLVVAPLLWVRR